MMAVRRPILFAALMVFAAATPATARYESIDFSQARTGHDCDALIRKNSGAFYAYACYDLAARRYGAWDEMARHLESRLSLEPDSAPLRVALGFIEADRGHERAISLFQEAAQGFAAKNDPGSECFVRTELAVKMLKLGQFDASSAQLDEAERLAEVDGNIQRRLGVLQARAEYYHRRGEETRSLALLREVEAAVFPDGPPYLQSQVLEALAQHSFSTGQSRAALDYYGRAAETFHRVGDFNSEANSRYGLWLVAAQLRALDQLPAADLDRFYKEAVESALRGGHRSLVLEYRIWEITNASAPLATKIAEVRPLVEQMGHLGNLGGYLTHKRALARMVSQAGKEHAPEAIEMLAQANAAARAAGMNEDHARGLLSLSWVHQGLHEREKATTAWLEALDQIEKLRDLQSDDIVRARFFSQWAFTYYRMISYLLWRESGEPSSEDIELALRVAERLRARTLLDTLDASSSRAKAAPTTAIGAKRDEVLSQIVRVQRRMLAPAINDEDRQLATAELSRLEMEEYRLREALSRENPSFQRLHDPRIPDIAAIQAALDPDQAVLSYQLTLEAVMSSWVILVTRDQAMAFPVPPRQRLEESVAAMLGLLERRDGSEAAGLRRLSADLLDAPLAKAGPGIRRLIVVPDGPLAQLPFERLVENPLEITRVPSVTAWSRWRERRQAAARGGEVLALADPELPVQGQPSVDEARSATLTSGLRLGRLPGSRLEAKALLHAFGGAGTVLAGSSASEHALKNSDLSRIRVLDFATHAVMDQEHPERNAVLLAAGSEEEDGLLQPREVAGLDLDGALVILSACSSATGQDIWGEGMLSLSRSFFQAGAVAVVGSLWPLRDEETAQMMKSFAGHLGEGLSVGAAMAAARADIKATGAPTQAWAGLVVLGDGDFVPLPGGRKRWPSAIGWAIAGLAAAVMLAWLLAKRLPAFRNRPA